MKRNWSSRQENLVMVALLIFASALIYLPWLGQIGYLNDDWYLMYSAHTHGAHSFVNIFNVDRPARALVMIPAYALFGDNPLYYNLSAYFFRLASALGFFWLLQMLWSRKRNVAFLASLLFLIYPGFLSQLNGIDYQSQMVGLAVAILSVALSLKASLTERPWLKITLTVLAVVLGWFYLGLVEYFLGFEYLRLAVLFLGSFRNNDTWRGRLLEGLKCWLPNIVIPLVFLTWRMFFFQSTREATDVGLQLGNLMESPLSAILWSAVRVIADSLDVLFLAWGIPFYSSFSALQLRHVLIGIGITAVVVVWAHILLSRRDPSSAEDATADTGQGEMLFVGLTMLIVGLIPIILVNRQVDFVNYTRYSLASSTGACLALSALLLSMSSVRLRNTFITLLVAVSVFTHHANALQSVRETQSIRSFWWQASWRIPQIEPGTTLIATYNASQIEEDYFIWSPANLIYYPEKVDDPDKVRPVLYAAVLNEQTKTRILSGMGQEFSNRKNIVTLTNYQNTLILTHPSTASCVHLLNGEQLEISSSEKSAVMVVAPYSKSKYVILDSKSHTPPEIVFGPEPSHDWCFYYEKADLVRQRGDWDEVRRLGDQALGKKLSAGDAIEWFPFIQAYAKAGDLEKLTEIKRFMNKASPYILHQACQIPASMPGLSSKVIETLNAQYCSE